MLPHEIGSIGHRPAPYGPGPQAGEDLGRRGVAMGTYSTGMRRTNISPTRTAVTTTADGARAREPRPDH